MGRALPTFAVLYFAYRLMLRSRPFAFWPTLIALVFLAVPPLLTNTFVAVSGVDPDTVEAARGIGMGERQVLFRLELPLASPLMLDTVRTVAVQVAATAGFGAVFGWGGLGRFIVDGFGLQDYPMMFAGAIMVAVLSLIVEFSLAGAQRLSTPAGLRPAKSIRKEEPIGTALDPAMAA